jgi:predicted Zn-dependent peptidase
VVTEKIPTVHSVAVGVWVNVGSRHENLQNQGISHFLEHMIFKGTQKRTALDIALEIESVGGQINAFTGKELTCFFAQLLDENVDIAMDVLSDITTNSLFLKEEVEKEKSVIIEEINNLEDTPEDLIYEYFIRELYPHHPLGYPILGTKETVNSFNSDGFKNLIKSQYSSSRVVIAAAGNIEHEQLIEMVTKSFNFSSEATSVDNQPLPKLQTGRKIWNRSISQTHIIIGTHSYCYADCRKYPFLVLNTILGGGMSSRLFQIIRETFGLAYSIYTFSETLSDTGLWGVYIGTDRNRIDKVVDLVQEEFRKLREVKIEERELERIKTQLKGNLMLGLESTSSRMHRLGKMEIYINDFVSLDDIIDRINQVKIEQVREVANELLQPHNLLTVIFIPLEVKE